MGGFVIFGWLLTIVGALAVGYSIVLMVVPSLQASPLFSPGVMSLDWMMITGGILMLGGIAVLIVMHLHKKKIIRFKNFDIEGDYIVCDQCGTVLDQGVSICPRCRKRFNIDEEREKMRQAKEGEKKA